MDNHEESKTVMETFFVWTRRRTRGPSAYPCTEDGRIIKSCPGARGAGGDGREAGAPGKAHVSEHMRLIPTER